MALQKSVNAIPMAAAAPAAAGESKDSYTLDIALLSKTANAAEITIAPKPMKTPIFLRW
jgi:hypothetical protein